MAKLTQALTRPLTLPVVLPLNSPLVGKWGGFSPLSLFANGEAGGWYDPSDLSTLFQDSAGTVPVTADGDPVGYVADKSGNGNHLTQATTASKPTYKTADGLHWLEGDGVDDWMQSAGNQTVTHPYTWTAALEHITGAGILTNVFSTSFASTLSTSTDAAGLYQRSDGVQRTMGAARRVGSGTANSALLTSAFVLGTPYIAQARVELSPDQVISRVGEAEQTAAATLDGTAVTNARFSLFYTGASANMKFFGGVAIARALTSAEDDALVAYLEGKAGL